MKRLFFVVVAAVAMLATSCSKDDTSTVVGGEKSTVTFAVAAPELATRAEYGDGYTATHLTWGVYDANGNYLENLSAEGLVGVDFPTGSLSTSVKIDLVNGKEYKVIFWAGAEGAPYAVDFETKKMTVNDALVANAEAYDAFYKHQAVSTVEGPRSETVTLTRPFAQLNIATADTAKAADGGLVVDQTQVVVPAYKTLDLVDGTVADEVERTYTFAAIPANNANGYNKTIEVGGKSYDLLSMNYLLVNTKEVEKVTFTVKQTSNGFTEEFEFENVPFQRNYKTNIIGNILTSTLDFEITIDPIFSNEMDYDGETGAVVVNVATMAELQDALDKAKGNTTIKFEQDITPEATRAALASVVATQKEGVNIIIDGNGKKFDGTFYIYGQARNTGKETLTFKNINFEHAAGALDFISCNTTDSEKRYAHNVTIEDCTFTGNTNGDVVGMRWRQCFNIVVKNVEATNMHSLMWATGTATIDIDGAELVNCLNGISVGTSTNVSVKNYSIDGGTYGLRADGSVDTTLTVADCDITAAQPIIVRNLTAAYNLVLEGENTLTTTDKYQIVLTAGADNVAYETPTGDYTLTGAEDFYVFEREAVVVKDDEELSDALTGADDVVVELGEGEFDLQSGVGNGNEGEVTLVGGGMDVTTVNGATNPYGNTNSPGNYAHGKHVVLRDLTFVTPNNGYQGGFGHAASVTFINCKIIGQFYAHSGAPHKFVNCTIDPLNGYLYTYASDCDFEGCTFESSEGKALQVYEDASVGENTVNINNCTFKAAKVAQTWDGKPVTAIDINSNGAKFVVNINNCTAEGYGVGLNSNSNLWNVKGGEKNITVKIDGDYAFVNGGTVETIEVSTVEELKEALVDAGTAGAGNTVIEFAEGTYEAPADWTPIKVDGYNGADIVTLNGNGATIKGLDAALFDGGFAGGSGIVIKDLTIEGATIVADNTQGYGAFICNADSMEEITLENCHLINSTIITPNDGADGSRIGGLVGWTSGYSNVNDGPVKTYVTIKKCSVVGCTIKGAGSIAGICGHAGASDWTYTTIENCTVTNNHFISTDTGGWRVGVVVGTANIGEVTINNITESGNTLEQTGKTAPTGEKRNYYGRFVPGTTGKLTIDGVAIQ
ncbi:MAG: hypothetical protein IJB39_00980 [Alistipes sp.]|nr:hypothetical protein [Alistipes sp.]